MHASRLWLAVLSLGVLSAVPSGAQQNAQGVTLVGRVRHITAPRLFAIDHRLADEGQILVLVPEGSPTPPAGTVVHARGVLRRLDEAEVGQRAWSALEPSSRKELAGRPVLIAESLGQPAGSTGVAAQPLPVRVGGVPPGGITVQPSTFAGLIGELAGLEVRIPYARVVGLFDSQSFLIDSAIMTSAPRGERDRVLVLVSAGALRVPAESLVASTVTVVGVARTLLGVQASGDAQWPSRLDRDEVKRLDVRAAVIATSVRTADGVELTDRPPTR